MPDPDSQIFLRELDMNGAERHGRPSNVARRVRAGARIKLWTAVTKLPARTEINMEKGFSTPLNKPRPYKIISTGKLIDDAPEAVEKETVHESFQDALGKSVGASELASWKHSLQQIDTVLEDAGIPNNAGVVIEFNIPQSGKRVDFIVTLPLAA